MKIGIFIPAYRESVHVETAYTLVREVAWCRERGIVPVPFHRANCTIDQARNWALHTAKAQRLHALLMLDADCAAPAVLSHLLPRILDGAAVAALVVQGRDGRPNTGPHEGEVGTGIMLINCAAIEWPAPWFRTELTDDGTAVRVGEDIGFCRQVRAHGRTVDVVEAETHHHGAHDFVFSPAAAVTAALRDGAPHRAVETSNG